MKQLTVATLRERHALRQSARRPAPAVAVRLPAWRLTLAGATCIPLIAYGVLFPLLRPLGEVPLLFVVAGSLVSVAALGRSVVPLPLLLLSVLGTFWLVLSFMRVLPPAWTIFYEPSAAIRQWSWLVLLPVFVTAFYAFFKRFGSVVWRHPLLLMLAYYAVSRIGLVFSDEENKDWDLPDLYGVSNINLPIFVLLFVFLFGRRKPILVDLLVVCAVAIFCKTATNLIVVASAGLIRVMPGHRALPALLGMVILGALLAAPHLAEQIYRLDGNSGVRAIMWRDAFNSVFQTNGVGVGFGTEYITNQFGSIEKNWELVDPRGPERLYFSTHSALYDVALRLGIAGSVLFLLWMARYAVIARTLTPSNSRIVASLAICLFAALAFNPGLTSLNISVGISVIVGLMELLRGGFDPSQAHAPASRGRRMRRRRDGAS